MRALYACLLKLEAILAGLFLLLMAVLIFTGGIARLLHHPLNWTIDLSTCFFAWATFLCADIAWRRDALMSIDVLSSRVPARVERALTYANYLIIAGFLCYAIYSGAVLSRVSWARSFQGIPGVSYSWVTMSISVGGALLLVTTLLKLRDALRADGLLQRPLGQG
jgi:TRAP-type C4-dicarboxylate transport system permease small subunit